MAVRTYNPKQVKTILAGVQLTGFAPDAMVEIERDEESFTKKVGCDGEVSRTQNNNKTGNAKISLMQTSPSNAVLSAALAADEATGNGIVPLLIMDLSGGSVMFSGNVWVKKYANQKYGKEVDVREWTLDMGDVDIFIGGN